MSTNRIAKQKNRSEKANPQFYSESGMQDGCIRISRNLLSGTKALILDRYLLEPIFDSNPYLVSFLLLQSAEVQLKSCTMPL